MSIYALPGALHQIISSGISAPKSTRDSDVSVSSSSSKETSGCQDLSLSSSSLTFIDSTAINPLHRRPSNGGLSSPMMGNGSDHSNSSSSSLGSSGRTSSGCGNSNVMIAVKEAKIDPERLIRSLSSSSKDTKKSSSSSSSSKKASSAQEGSGGEDSTTPNGQRRRSSLEEEDSSESSRECDPHEDAIKFDISVSFNGREYTATRTLPRILQFRCDLIKEFRARRKWRERRRKRKDSVPRMAKVMDLSDDEEEEDTIPELPRLADDAAGGHGNGFTMLNALLRPYGTGVERWLLKVLDIVPHDSQCLSQFLWEPLSGHAATSKKYERRRSSLSALGAIHETQDDNDSVDYDSDTDVPLLIH